MADWDDERLTALFERVDNAGRWGPDDELGTLNYITPDKRRRAAALVREGETISLSLSLAAAQIEHRPFYHHDPSNPLHAPPSAGEHLGLEVHQHKLTHLDCISHIGSHEGLVYNRRPFDEVTTENGVTHGSIYAQRAGIVSRGVLLDVAHSLGLDWLEPSHQITVPDVEAAERLGRVRVESGDIVLIRSGSDARAAAEGPSPFSPGPGPDLIEWLHERQVAVYAGDAPERLTSAGSRILGLLSSDAPEASEPVTSRFPLPLHQIGIPAMGLVLLDYCSVEELAARCRE
ncbi:MAG: cyclase family protein, partial [Gaiellaceae bacterium]